MIEKLSETRLNVAGRAALMLQHAANANDSAAAKPVNRIHRYNHIVPFEATATRP